MVCSHITHGISHTDRPAPFVPAGVAGIPGTGICAKQACACVSIMQHWAPKAPSPRNVLPKASARRKSGIGKAPGQGQSRSATQEEGAARGVQRGVQSVGGGPATAALSPIRAGSLLSRPRGAPPARPARAGRPAGGASRLPPAEVRGQCPRGRRAPPGRQVCAKVHSGEEDAAGRPRAPNFSLPSPGRPGPAPQGSRATSTAAPAVQPRRFFCLSSLAAAGSPARTRPSLWLAAAANFVLPARLELAGAATGPRARSPSPTPQRPNDPPSLPRASQRPGQGERQPRVGAARPGLPCAALTFVGRVYPRAGDPLANPTEERQDDEMYNPGHGFWCQRRSRLLYPSGINA